MTKGNRTGKGWFQPGQSGNPTGRSKKDLELSTVAKQHAEAAVATLVDIMLHGAKESDRLNAATEILDRGYGRPPQALEHKVERDQPAVWTVNICTKELPNPKPEPLPISGDFRSLPFYKRS